MSSEFYTKDFYELLRAGATRSAEAIAPIVLQLLPVRSVVDVGCGDGSWLAVFRKLGIQEILGVDGDYVNPASLQIPPDCFRAMDLTRAFSLDRVFDLVVSLEVAEHLPAECAPVFVECLTRIAPLVLFSAAIPFQGGLNHINEQWPDKWADLFGRHGYLPIDFLRKRIWQNDSVEWWYVQNTLLFASPALLQENAVLRAELDATNPNQLSLVHPRQYLSLEAKYREAASRAEHPRAPSGLREATNAFLSCLRNAITKRISTFSGRDRTTS